MWEAIRPFIVWLARNGFDALTAIGAIVAALAAVGANRQTRKVLAEQRAAERAWLVISETLVVNHPGAGFEVRFRLKNFGQLPSRRPSLALWVASGDSPPRLHTNETSGATIVPSQHWLWIVTFTAAETPGDLMVRLRDGVNEEWVAFEWPYSSGELASHLSNIDAENSDRLETLVRALPEVR